jgi:uncharacterized protein YdeI (YjbR/CyaY-like superfamily)
MRCPFGATPKCKVIPWRSGLDQLRFLALASGLKEELKWGIPVYTINGKNVLNISAFRDFFSLGFFKGVLLKDANKILTQQGNIRSSRIVRFNNVDDVTKLEFILSSYIQEAIQLELSGAKVEANSEKLQRPFELEQILENDPVLKAAFHGLSPGRQKGYAIFFSQPKKSETRIARIKKMTDQILRGKGLHDAYKDSKK